MPITNKHCWRTGLPLATAVVIGFGLLLGCQRALTTSVGKFSESAPTDTDFTRLFTCTPDEAFEGSQEALQRMGMFVEDLNKPKGRITGNGYHFHPIQGKISIVYAVYIQPVPGKHQTRVSLSAENKSFMVATGWGHKDFMESFLSELQKVLVTYK